MIYLSLFSLCFEDHPRPARYFASLFYLSLFSVVDVSKITDTILAQRGIGSVIKQSIPDDIDDGDGSEDPNEVRNIIFLQYSIPSKSIKFGIFIINSL